MARNGPLHLPTTSAHIRKSRPADLLLSPTVTRPQTLSAGPVDMSQRGPSCARRPPNLRLPHPSRAPAARRRWRWRSGHGSARAAAKSRMPRRPAARGRPWRPGARGPGRPVVSAGSAVAGACEGCSSTLEAAVAHAATTGAAGGAASSAGGARKQAQGCRRARRPTGAGERDDQQCRGFGRHGHDKILWACAWAEGVTRQAARPGPLAYLCRAKPDPFVPGLARARARLGRAARIDIYSSLYAWLDA